MATAADELRPAVARLEKTRERTPRVAFAYRPCPDRVLLDLALQAAGAVSTPLSLPAADEAPFADPSPPPLDDAELDGWVRGAANEPEPAGLPCLPWPAALDLAAPVPRDARWPEVAAGGVRVEDAEGPVEISPAALAEAAARLDRQIHPTPPKRREILVSARPLSDPGERWILAWALASGAAVVLEPRPGCHVATAAWARPTIFYGDPEEVEKLAAAAESYRSPFPLPWLRRLRRRPPPRPFDRLHTVVLRRGEPPVGTTGWPARGVSFLRLSEGFGVSEPVPASQGAAP